MRTFHRSKILYLSWLATRLGKYQKSEDSMGTDMAGGKIIGE